MSDGSVELLPCPFCGGSAAIDDTSGIFSTDCVDCMASNQRGFGSRAEAADAWNTRAQSAEITRLKAELAKAEAQAARIVELEAQIASAAIDATASMGGGSAISGMAETSGSIGGAGAPWNLHGGGKFNPFSRPDDWIDERDE